MIPTLPGLILLTIGLIVLLAGSRMAMLAYVMGCALFNGSASLVLPALGNTSVQPAIVATGLLLLRCVLPDRRGAGLPRSSLADHRWLALFVAWCFLGAFTLPFVFAGTLTVVPLRPTGSPTGLETHALRFTPQNLTTACYMAATLAGAVCAHGVARTAPRPLQLARLASAIALAHAAIGWAALLADDTPAAAIFAMLRNGRYMQLDQSFSGFGRMTGISPETSLYASFGFAWLVFTAELWLRNVDRRWSGAAALAMGLTLAASTSTTAYVGLACYGAVLVARLAYGGGTVPAGKGLALGFLALVALAAGLALAALADEAPAALVRMLQLTTTAKLESASGVARLFWAGQGLDAFAASWGLGIGAGSFRSSSIATAILGSGGVIAAIAFVFHLAHLARPLAPGTWAATGDPGLDVAAAAAWTALLMLIPAAVSAPSPDPGLVWGLIGGSALGLRHAAEAGLPRPRVGRLPHPPAIRAPSGATA